MRRAPIMAIVIALLGVVAPTAVPAASSADAASAGTGTRPPAAVEAPEVVRIAGPNRVVTAVEVSAATFAPGVDTVYVATASAFPDALTGGPAAARDGAPVLLVTATSLPDATRDEIERLAPRRIVILGGEAAVGESVAVALADLVAEPVERIAGANRFATAADIAATFDAADTAYLATGANFPDALTGGAAAARDGAPILLVTGSGVPAPTLRELDRLRPTRLVVLGGVGVVPDDVVETARQASPDAVVTRLAGATRYATAGQIGATFHVGRPEVFVATGRNFPDAMTGTPAAAAAGAPLFLVTADGIPDDTAAALTRARPRRITILGGAAAVGAQVETDLADFLVAPAVHHIGTREVDGRTELVDRRTGEAFRPRGTNHLDKVVDATEQHPGAFATDLFRPGTADLDEAAAELDRMAELGYDTVRVFIDLCRTDCITERDDGIDGPRPAYLANIAAFLELAKARDLVVMLASNDVPDPDYSDRLPCCEPFGGYRNSLWLTPEGHDIAVEYWTDVVSGLLAADAPLEQVFAYQVQQEQFVFGDVAPFTMASGTVTTADGKTWDMASAADRTEMLVSNTRLLTNRLRTAIRELDPDALVTIGFFPDHPSDVRIVPSAGLFEATELDFIDLHPYPGQDRTLDEMMDAFGWHAGVDVPIVMGEYGAFRFAYADPETSSWALLHWMEQSCAYDFAGWLTWIWQGTDDEVFGMRDDADRLAIALSPVEHPDPCDASGVPVNLALDATATASQSNPGQPPGHAIDGLSGTLWGAGGDAPQHLEVDLGAAHDVARIDLLVEQFPAGATHHTLSVAPANHVFTEVADFAGDTASGDVLTWSPGAPASVRYVRVETLASPSHVAWSEVAVYGP